MYIPFKTSELLMLLAASTMSFLANLPDSVLGEIVDRRVLIASLLAVVVVAMFRYLQVMLLLTICILAIGANLPSELASQLEISQGALLVSLGILVTMTLVNRALKLVPMGTETPSELISNKRRALMEAIAQGDIAKVERFLSKGMNVNFTMDGMIPIHLAAKQGDTDIVELLISHGGAFKPNSSKGKFLNSITGSFAMYGQEKPRHVDKEMWRG